VSESNNYLKKYGFEINSIASEKSNQILTSEMNDSEKFHLDYYLKHKPQIILAGPPGTSKTWHALDYVKNQQLAKRFGSDDEATAYWDIVQFHPSYGYEDFISGVKAKTVNQNLTFEQKQGIFLKMAIEAKKNPSNNYYLIIDEINRGVLGRIFGELILTLEYRDLAVHLPDEKEPLNIPNNLYLIGTMNTADRNIALVDHALRRRFLIIEKLPDEIQINNYHDSKPNSQKIRNRTLEAFRITQSAFYKSGTEEYDSDMNGYNMQDYAVGHTYFMADTDDQLNMNIKHQVIPLLGEYQREGVITKSTFEKVKSELNNFY
jgi:5-methylcytosine-specific restriction protein B